MPDQVKQEADRAKTSPGLPAAHSNWMLRVIVDRIPTYLSGVKKNAGLQKNKKQVIREKRQKTRKLIQRRWRNTEEGLLVE